MDEIEQLKEQLTRAEWTVRRLCEVVEDVSGVVRVDEIPGGYRIKVRYPGESSTKTAESHSFLDAAFEALSD